jgi:2-oxoglutarate ferredoxin oxidoreductase subunit gamma
MQLTEIRVAGFGGQGVILFAMIIGKAASIFESGYATLTQSFGPEARGGAASAQLILSDEPVLYPYVTSTDILVVMSQEAYTKFTPELKDTGILIVEEDLVSLSELPAGIRVYGVPATRLAEQIGKRMVLNVVMVGFFAAITGLLAPDSLRKAVADSVPSAMQDLNLKAFDEGFDFSLTKLKKLGKEEVESPPCQHS